MWSKSQTLYVNHNWVPCLLAWHILVFFTEPDLKTSSDHFFVCLNKGFPPGCWWRSFRDSRFGRAYQWNLVESNHLKKMYFWIELHVTNFVQLHLHHQHVFTHFFSSNTHGPIQKLPRHGIEYSRISFMRHYILFDAVIAMCIETCSLLVAV